MRCPCADNRVPGYVPAGTRFVRGRLVDDYRPCPDCAGSLVIHCCEGECAAAEAPAAPYPPARVLP